MSYARRDKDLLFQAISVMGKAFASPVRLELLDLLAQAPRTVEALARATGQSNANVSQHLQALHAAGMVTRERQGTSVRYEIAGPDALRLWVALRDASIMRLAEVERAARDYLGEDVEVIGREELRERLVRGDAILIDVRPQEEYEAGHIEGARSIPIEELDEHLTELPRDRQIVAYCRGPFCAFAHEAVRRLMGPDTRRRALTRAGPNGDSPPSQQNRRRPDYREGGNVNDVDTGKAPSVTSRTVGDWMRSNLTTQGYRLNHDERRRLTVGLRFSTGTCLLLVITALALESPAIILALTGVGLIAGVTSRHPFDLVWNFGVRHLAGGPELPPNPTRRRHAFKIATVWLLVVGTLFAAGMNTVALILGGLLVVACTTVTATNFCIPSELLALWERRRTHSIAHHDMNSPRSASATHYDWRSQ